MMAGGNDAGGLLLWLLALAATPYVHASQPTPPAAAAGARPSWPVHRLKTSADSRSGEEGEWLGQLVSQLARQELHDCQLLLALDEHYYKSPLMHHLDRLPNIRQVVVVRAAQDLDGVQLGGHWAGQDLGGVQLGGHLCSANIFLLHDASPLLAMATRSAPSWDCYGRYVITGLSKQQLEALTLTEQGRKTQHIVGLVKLEGVGEWQVYINQLYSSQLVRPVTTWRRTTFTRPPHIFPDKIFDLGGAILNVVAFEFPPAIMYDRGWDGSLLRRYGRDVEVVRALAKVFNFTIKFVEPPQGQMWGERLANGSWNGMVGLLGRGEGDLAIANLFITSLMGRREFQEFSSPYDHSVSCCLVRMSPPLPRWHAPSWPFRGQAWLAILAGLLLTGPLLYCLARAPVPSVRDIGDFQSFTSSCLYAVSVHLREARTQVPVRGSGRVMVAFLWAYVIVLTTTYSSNLTAFLTVTRQSTAIDTFRDLHGSQLSVVGLGPYYKNIMAQSENRFLRELSERFIPVQSGVAARVLSGSSVYLSARSSLEYLATQLTSPRGEPTVRLMKECSWPFSVAVAYQRRSPLKPSMDPVIDKMFESGLVAYWFHESLRLSKQKIEKGNGEDGRSESDGVTSEGGDGSRTMSLNIDHMQGIFFILGVCYLISILIFLAEMYTRLDLRSCP